MIKQPHKIGPFRPHGGIRGDNLDRRSSQFEGLFGRIFRSLPAATWSEAALKELAGDGHAENRMAAEPETVIGTLDSKPVFLPLAPREDVDDSNQPRQNRLHDDEENEGIDAGYTYLGQFIDHDMTFDPASSLQGQNDVNALVDFRTPRLDLDSVYGRGPEDQPYMYSSDGRLFQIGNALTGGIRSNDLPRHSWHETIWNEHKGKLEDVQFNRALIGDKRNDENVIISQLHGIFLKFHNRYATDHSDLSFQQVQRWVRWHYQYVILHDFLFKIAKQSVLYSVLPHLASRRSILEDSPKLRFFHPKNDAFIPIEFAAAVYRFGHSMVRPIYRLNTTLTGGNNPDTTDPNEIARGIDGRQFIFAGLPGRGLNGFDSFPKEWGIDWNLFFDLTDDKATRFGKDRTQPAYKIDTSIVNPLAFLPEFSKIDQKPPLDDVGKLQAHAKDKHIPNNLALRNLLRGMAMSLPSGQDVARAMGLTPLKDEELKVGKATNALEYNNLPTLRSIHKDFIGKAPLWYYVLAEAQHDWLLNGGLPETPVQLGEVGSRIVVETFVGLLLEDGHSFLRQAPAWTPEIGKKEKFDMPDFIKYALELL
ncbi:peroxidase family protein [Larkinella knui]|uniref:Heme peroxidase n=1 Tax=Larkinella knui TaxID=2025310 RepID=A0A3P1CXX2_9BACT|nr:heme peroxidase family protein [Larkinella knui]RRB18079.1 heme peroxidase [Larkinella knui]